MAGRVMAQRAQKGGKWSDLHDAAEENNPNGVAQQLQSGVNPNLGDKKCWTPLHEAAEKGHGRVVDALLRASADPNLGDENGWTALMAAAEHGHTEVIRSLLNAGARTDFQDKKGWSCTMEAAEKRHVGVVRLLVEHGALLNLADDRGWTALMAACEGGDVKCVRYLWIAGAEHNLEDSNRWTALDEAKYCKNKEIVEFMQPIVDAEASLRKMLAPEAVVLIEEAVLALEKAQLVWCLKDLVQQCSSKLSVMLQQRIIEGATDRDACFDLLLSHSPGAFPSQQNSNEQGDGNPNPELGSAAAEICRQRLKDATARDSVTEIKWAMSMSVRSGCSQSIGREFDDAKAHWKSLAKVPEGWDLEGMLSSIEHGTGRMVLKKPVTDPEALGKMQALLESTFRKKYTRDRKGDKVPQKLKLEKLVSIQNTQIMEEYALRVKALPAPGAMADLPSILTQQGTEHLPKLNAAINEQWLWHGTNEKAAEAITTDDFRLNLAGSNAGTLYGPGIYCADCCSKSDEYCTPNAEGLRCLLLCRVALGRVHYTEEMWPDTKQLTSKCLSGEYDSVLGDREKCRGTYKEFIVFDDDQIYPEFLLYYKREYDEEKKAF